MVLQDKGYQAMLDLVSYYKENASILRKTFQDMGFSVYGGENAPYVWVGFPEQASWDVFADILHKCNIVTTPGSGFGPAGEGFVRASAFGHRLVRIQHPSLSTARLIQHFVHSAALLCSRCHSRLVIVNLPKGITAGLKRSSCYQALWSQQAML